MYFSYNTDEHNKIWFTSERMLKVKTGETVTAYNLRHAILYITYSTADLEITVIMEKPTTSHLGGSYISLAQDVNASARLQSYPNLTYPYYVHVGDDETETDEPVDRTILFPPRETTEEWGERISAELLFLARRIAILRHEEPHHNSRSRRICNEVNDNHEEVHRYDHSVNLLKLAVGWFKLQLNGYEQRYLAEVKKVGKPVPDFDINKRDELETLFNKMSSNLTEDRLQEHFDLHNTDEWRQAHAERKIVLCNDDCSVGELIADINSYHTSRGVTHHALAERSFHDVSTKHWVQAKRTPHRKLVTERTVTLS